MTEDLMNYSALIDQAMRGVVRDVLRRIHSTGLPGEHHFYISFDTNHPGVQISDQLKTKYPKDVTIVLQHQFWDFKVEDHQFHVTLSFGGVPEKLTVPFDALTAFADPSIKFGLQFQQDHLTDAEMAGLENMDDILSISVDDQDTKTAPDESAEVISLDSFRKK